MIDRLFTARYFFILFVTATGLVRERNTSSAFFTSDNMLFIAPPSPAQATSHLSRWRTFWSFNIVDNYDADTAFMPMPEAWTTSWLVRSVRSVQDVD